MKVKQPKQPARAGSLAEPDFGNGGDFPSRVGKKSTKSSSKYGK